MGYGYPRTYQTDEVVGHFDSLTHPSHFIVLNDNGKPLIIELEGGDPSKILTYLGPTILTERAELVPVTLNFRDVNGDGRFDMVLMEGGTQVLQV